jgi:hypothetical protein
MSGILLLSVVLGFLALVWFVFLLLVRLRGWRWQKCSDCGHLRGDHSPAGCLVRDYASTLGFCRCSNDGG